MRSREAAYRKFILELYHATPATDRAWLHGMKGGCMAHVDAMDAPVTLADVQGIARETWKAAGAGSDSPSEAGADILGWDLAFESGATGPCIIHRESQGVPSAGSSHGKLR